MFSLCNDRRSIIRRSISTRTCFPPPLCGLDQKPYISKKGAGCNGKNEKKTKKSQGDGDCYPPTAHADISTVDRAPRNRNPRYDGGGVVALESLYHQPQATKPEGSSARRARSTFTGFLANRAEGLRGTDKSARPSSRKERCARTFASIFLAQPASVLPVS